MAKKATASTGTSRKSKAAGGKSKTSSGTKASAQGKKAASSKKTGKKTSKTSRKTTEKKASAGGTTKRKAAKKKRTTRSSASAKRVKLVWKVFNSSFKEVASFPYPERKAADAAAAKLTKKSGQDHFVDSVKVPMEDDE